MATSKFKMAAALALVAMATSVADAFFFGGKTDCLVSEWGEWSQPFGFGQISRERVVLRYPTNGGEACPTEMQQVNLTDQKPTVNATAKSFFDNFLNQVTLRDGWALGQARDLLIIVDASGSIGKVGFAEVKDQLARLLGIMCPSPDPFNAAYHRAAVLEYSSSVRELFDFDALPATSLVQDAVRNMTYMGSTTCTASAFKYARANVLTEAKGMRSSPDVKQEVFILTDGKSNCGGDAIAAARLLRDRAEVYGLMSGLQTPEGILELSEYVSAPMSTHLFALEDYEELSRMLDAVETEMLQYPCPPFDV